MTKSEEKRQRPIRYKKLKQLAQEIEKVYGIDCYFLSNFHLRIKENGKVIDFTTFKFHKQETDTRAAWGLTDNLHAIIEMYFYPKLHIKLNKTQTK